jgi:hypothetical protein
MRWVSLMLWSTSFHNMIIQIKDGGGSLVTDPSLTCKATKCNNGNILETSCSGSDKAVILSACLTSEIVGPYTSSGHHHGNPGNTGLFSNCGYISGAHESDEPLWVFLGDLYRFLFIICTYTMTSHMSYLNCFYSLWAPYCSTSQCPVYIHIPDPFIIFNWHKSHWNFEGKLLETNFVKNT